MRKIIQNPLVDVVLTFLIAYLLMYKSWFVGDFLLITLPNILGIDLQPTQHGILHKISF